MLSPAFVVFAVLNCALPVLISNILASYKPSVQQFQLIKCFSLLLLGMFLSALATLNFSLSFLVGLLAAPLSFMQPCSSSMAGYSLFGILQLISPTTVLHSASAYFGVDIGLVLKEAAFGWNVWGMYTPMVLWCVWWPAWLVSSVLVLGRPVQ